MWQSQHVELQSSDIVEIWLLQESELQMYWTFDLQSHTPLTTGTCSWDFIFKRKSN